MGGHKIPAEQKRSRIIGVRLTPAQYARLEEAAAAQSKKLGFKVTVSEIAVGLLTRMMPRA